MDSTGAPKPKQIESKVPGSTRSPATNASSLSRRQHRNKQIGKPVRKTHGKSVAECYESLPGPQSPSVVEDDDELDRRCLSAQSRTTERPEQAEKRLETICGAVRTVIECLGDDPDRESLQATPFRYAKALLFLTQGYHLDLKDIVNNAIFHERHDGMVIVKDIDISSLCEHHLVPFIGKVYLPGIECRSTSRANYHLQMQIGYVPSDVIIGLSKLARIAEMFSRRLQIQERLTKEVAQAIAETIKPQGVIVTVESSHLCMVMRGVQKTSSTSITTCALGCFDTEPDLRAQFLNLLAVNKT
jgi:GTP cyclohydrolase I